MIKKRRQRKLLKKVWGLKYLFIFILILVVFFRLIIFQGPPPLTGHWARAEVGDHWEYNCSNCSDCNDAIDNASSGDIIRLNESLSDLDGYCIGFNGKDNITFDCQGHYIEGDGGAVYDVGISLTASGGSNNNIIRNCNVSKFYYGVFIQYSSNNTLTNITSNYNSYAGIAIESNSNNNTLNNIIANHNSKTGIYLALSSNNTFTNITVLENNERDVSISASFDHQCNHNFTNITGSGNRPIEFYNYSTTVQDKELSQLILCNADGITIDNVTIRGSDTKKNNWFYLTRTENARISNINSSGNYMGIRLSVSSNNNTLTSITSNSNTQHGIYISNSNNNTLTSITSNSNSQRGIILSSSNNTLIDTTSNSNTQYGIYIEYGSSNLTNITANSNSHGIYIYGNTHYNIIKNSHIENSTQYGIYFESSAQVPDYNKIYNNLFNNSINYGDDCVNLNYFNTTKIAGTNIMGRHPTAGNYWAYPNGTGFSETCEDSNVDGICDLSYNLDGSNYDYLPLSSYDCAEDWLCTDWSFCSGGTQTRTCTDENFCGTTNIKPAESQTCTVPGGGITTGQPTATHSWDTIEPEQPAEMEIDNPEIGLTAITVTTSETVQGASIKVTKIDVVPQADIQIGMTGETYQSFKIETIGIDDTNIENVIIEFKVNKTWADEQGTIDDINLYKKQDVGNKWDTLETTFVSEDSQYYYFSAVSPGFSTFMIFIGSQLCIPGETRCFNNQIQLCLGNSTWIVTKNCPGGCEGDKCVSAGFWYPGSLLFYLIIVMGTLLAIYLGYKHISTKKRKK